MARPKEGNFSAVTLNLNRGEFENFEKNFGKGKASELIRQYIKDENDRVTKEKKGERLGKGLINFLDDNTKKAYLKDNRQTTIDVFAKTDEIVQFLQATEDPGELRKIKTNAQLIVNISKTKLIKKSRAGEI